MLLRFPADLQPRILCDLYFDGRLEYFLIVPSHFALTNWPGFYDLPCSLKQHKEEDGLL